MSEGAITCKSGNEEKIAVLLAENENLKEQLKTHGASTPLSTGLKTTTYVSLVVALIALCAAFCRRRTLFHYCFPSDRTEAVVLVRFPRS